MGNQSSRKKNTYKVPPGAGKPDPPDKPTVEYIGDDVMVRWNEPRNNGGCPIIGYVLQFNRVDGDLWESYRVEGTECMLQNLDDTFVFRVVAENLVGYSEPSETSVPVSFEFSEPVLLVPLNNVTRAIEFEKVELSCRVWGMPSPELTWYLNGDEILPNNRIFMNTDGIDYKLIFNHIKISDEGEIKAVAKNLLGEIETSGSVVVEAPPRIKSPKNYDDGVICRVGEALRLKFGCHGRPKPEVTWYHDGEPLRRGFKVQEIGDVAVLTVDAVTRKDAGEYTIRVENNIGEDMAHVLVTVIDRPSPPGKPTVIQLSDNSCVLEWEAHANEDVTTYIVEYFRDGWGVWLTAVSTRNRGCKIRDLIPGSKYRFRIKAENHFGTSEGGEESVQIYIPESNKEHGNVMSSIQEDEFEVIPDDAQGSTLEQIIPPIPETRKPRPDKRHLDPHDGSRESLQRSQYDASSLPPKSPARSRNKASSGFPEVSIAQSYSQSNLTPTKPDTNDTFKDYIRKDHTEPKRTSMEDYARKPWESIRKTSESMGAASQVKTSSQRTEDPIEEPAEESYMGRHRGRPWESTPQKPEGNGRKTTYDRRDLIKSSDSWRTSPERLQRPSSAPPTELPKLISNEDTSIFRRNQIIGSASNNSKSNDALHSTSRSPDCGGSKYFDHYGRVGNKTVGADRFAKYRQDPKSNNASAVASSSNSLNLGSHPGSTEEWEQSSKDGGSFVIVEDYADDDDEEESADCVVSQLIVPVRSGSVKISTSFDNGRSAASSRKSSMDDLSFDISRTHTPDYLSSSHRQLLFSSNNPSRDDLSLSRGSSRSNLLESLAEFTDGRLRSESKENLEENPFYQEATRKAASASRGGVSKSSAAELRKQRRGDDEEMKKWNVPTEARGAMNETATDDVNNELFRKKGGPREGKVGGEKAPTTSSSTPPPPSSPSPASPETSLKYRLKGLLDTTTALLFLGLLGPLLFMNAYIFALFCLLLIKMTFM